MCQTNQSIPGNRYAVTDCLDQRVTTTVLYIVVVWVNVVYISVGGVASPSLMPGQTVGSPTHPQRANFFWNHFQLRNFIFLSDN